jgi:putative ABC transport system permease protein
MNVMKIAWRNLWYKPLNTILGIVLLSFGIGIISLLTLLREQMGESFDRNVKDIDFVLAAKGSPVQSILANVYHIDAPTGNIKMSEAQRLIRNPMVEQAIPLAYGDNYERFRIVGTNEKYLQHYQVEFAQGNIFTKPFEAVLGAKVASEAKLVMGSEFTSVHGYDRAASSEDHHHQNPFVVVGILKPSGTVLDHLILTPVESVWLVHEHPVDAAEGDSAMIAADEKEVTAYLIKKRNKGAFGMLSKMAENTTLQLANVAVENSRLMNNFSLGTQTVAALALVIVMISLLSVFITLLNAMKERKYEMAVMRTMGASRGKLLSMVWTEGILSVLMGYVCGLLIGRLALFILGTYLEEGFHYGLNIFQFSPWEVIVFGVVLILGTFASLLPALKATRTDISKTLSHA